MSLVLGFELEWLNEVSGIVQILHMKFFLDDNTIELLTETSSFLKRIFYPHISLSDMFVGNTITIYNRLMIVKKYANKATTEYMNAREVRFLCKVDRRDLHQFGTLLLMAKKHGLVLGKVLTVSDDFYSSAITSVASGDVVAELVGILSTNKDGFQNEVLTDKKLSSATVVKASTRDIDEALNTRAMAQMKKTNCTLCVIKPHVIKAQQAGELLTHISSSGYCIEGLFSVHMTLQMAHELFEVYRGVLPNYTALIEHMCITPVLAVLITGGTKGSTGSDWDDTTVVSSFREFAGPHNPSLAKALRPRSLRALFGVDSVRNAVHCTDLEDDGELECRYFFETLASL